MVKQQIKNIEIVSLNYDNCIELACKKNSISLKTGIEEWSKDGKISSSFDGLFLIKLHGSINWKLKDNELTEKRPLISQAIEKLSDELLMNDNYRPALIFGQKNKLTAKGPFLELFRLFQEKIEQAELLTVIGYSFRDEHINEVISNWINYKSSRKIRIINGKSFNENEVNFTNQLLRLKDRLEVIKEDASDGIKQLY